MPALNRSYSTSGHMTFHLRPEMIVKHGAPLTILQASMNSVGHTFQNTGTGWRITDAMAAMSAQEIHDVAEVALSGFEEVQTAVMKSI